MSVLDLHHVCTEEVCPCAGVEDDPHPFVDECACIAADDEALESVCVACGSFVHATDIDTGEPIAAQRRRN